VPCRKALLNADRLDLQAPDRRAPDEAVFDMLGLTAGEREAVINLVRATGEGTERVICHNNVKGTACRALTNNMPCPNNTPRPMARHAVHQQHAVPCGTLPDSVSCRKALLNTDRLDLQAPDRRALDEVVFDVLGLTVGEREAVINLVRATGEGKERVTQNV
jgi:hypothetical protein